MSIDVHTLSQLDGSNFARTDRVIVGELSNQANVAGGSAGVSVTTAITAFSGLPATPAMGSATFSANPANNDTLTIGGSAVTFVTSGATGLQVNIGASLSATLASLLTLLSGSADSNLVKFYYAVSGSVLTFEAATPGIPGNSLTLAKSSTAITLSAATLSGGTANYNVFVSPNQDAVAYVTGKTNSGFNVVLNPRLAANTLAAGTFDLLVLA